LIDSRREAWNQRIIPVQENSCLYGSGAPGVKGQLGSGGVKKVEEEEGSHSRGLGGEGVRRTYVSRGL